MAPLTVLMWAALHTTVSSANVVAYLSRIAAGATIAAAPIVACHLWHQSLGAWLNDTFRRSLSVSNLDHISRGRFLGDVVRSALPNVFGVSLAERLNGLYWLVLVCIAFAVGVGLARRLVARWTPAWWCRFLTGT